jgi:hypothetical protein
MADPPPRASWWTTLPGVLTAVAALLTAGAALVGALNQAGLFALFRREPAPAAAPAPPPAPPVAPPADPPVAVPPVTPPVVPLAEPPAATPPLAVTPTEPGPAPLEGRIDEAWTVADGGLALRVTLRNAGSAARLVEPRRDLRLLDSDGTAHAPRRAAPVFETLAPGAAVEVALEFPPLPALRGLRLGAAPDAPLLAVPGVR